VHAAQVAEEDDLINPQPAEAARLTISSKLLRVAEVITPTGR